MAGIINRYTTILLLSLVSHLAFAQHDVPATDAFKITGAVKNELKLTISDLVHFRQDTLGNVVIRNKKGEEKSRSANLKGVLLKTILDSAHITTEKHKEYSELYISLIASDDYRNVYSWNELFNTPVGDRVYIITEMDGKSIADMPQRILVMSLADFNSGRRHLKGLARIEVKRLQ